MATNSSNRFFGTRSGAITANSRMHPFGRAIDFSFRDVGITPTERFLNSFLSAPASNTGGSPSHHDRNQLAHYEITSHLGSGGTGDVYQATDSKLGRSVTIKRLPEAFTHDADRAARFEREAGVLASLNHPTSQRSTASNNPLTGSFL